MAKTIYVNCSFCKGMMEVDVETGEVVNKWSHTERDQNAEDRMASALKKLDHDKKKRATLFDKTKDELEGQKKKLEDSFKEQIERAKKEGPGEKLIRPFDLD